MIERRVIARFIEDLLRNADHARTNGILATKRSFFRGMRLALFWRTEDSGL